MYRLIDNTANVDSMAVTSLILETSSDKGEARIGMSTFAQKAHSSILREVEIIVEIPLLNFDILRLASLSNHVEFLLGGRGSSAALK